MRWEKEVMETLLRWQASRLTPVHPLGVHALGSLLPQQRHRTRVPTLDCTNDDVWFGARS